MDWRSLSRVSLPAWLGSIMALIVESDSNRPEGRRVRRAGLRTPARERLWPAGNRDGCRWLLTVAILLVTCLARPIGCSRGELHVHEYAILRTDPCAGNVQPASSFGGGKSALKLSELVTQSDVIFKAFAGYGNDLRAVALGNGTEGVPMADASHHRPHQQQQQQQYHHQPRWKPQARMEQGGAKAAGADFIVRLEPATVYKGNELFKQLQLNSWQHYFILWSNGSVEYTHRDVPPIQGSAGSESSVPNTTQREPDTSSPASVAFARRSAASGIWPTMNANCTNRRPLTHQRLPKRTQASAVAEAEHFAEPAPPIDTDEPIDRITITTTTPYIARAFTDDNAGDQKPLSAGERVNLQHGTGDSPSQQADERETAQPGPPATNGPDFQREGQISRTLSEILPVTLVVFGRLVGGGGGGGRTDKLLRVDPYVGLLRWDERLEDALWQTLGTIDLLAAVTPSSHWRTAWDESVEDRINYAINQLDQNFTLMMSLRLKPVSDDNDRQQGGQTASVRPTSGHIFSIRSKLTAGSSLSINFETDGHGGLRVLQEKYGLSEMLPVRSGALTLRDGAWHSLALSGRYGGFVTVYIDCQWINSFVLTKGSIELPQYPTVEVGHSVELRQLTVVPGEKSARLQCNPRPVPIHDVENRRVTDYFEHLN
ncbi:uncharacterized protein LOC121588201 isoform X2 [Anopheles merus]|uniref:uncharacterized protein LOC121588201 isoform X2 n=1 Tax=Anopheles merus TaxID=30066 RepID=UPI001BE44070|nr:uncharacterized protein LOC121588201 isoform X2 [Anopheles merus]